MSSAFLCRLKYIPFWKTDTHNVCVCFLFLETFLFPETFVLKWISEVVFINRIGAGNEARWEEYKYTVVTKLEYMGRNPKVVFLSSPSSDCEVFSKNHAAPFSKVLTFYRKEPFTLEAYYSCPQGLPYPDPAIGEWGAGAEHARTHAGEDWEAQSRRSSEFGAFQITSSPPAVFLPGSDQQDEPHLVGSPVVGAYSWLMCILVPCA